MRQDREIRCFDYVNHPYDQVRTALSNDPVALFHRATQAAATRAGDVASSLHVNIGGFDISTDIAITVDGIVELPGSVTSPPSIRLQIAWEGADKPRLFPFMKAELSAYRLTAHETQLDFAGNYDPPLGALGDAVDAVLTHRLAEASVHRFLADIAAHLKTELSRSNN